MRTRKILRGLVLATSLFATILTARAEWGTYRGYVSGRGVVLDEQGVPTWVSYGKTMNVGAMVTDTNGKRVPGEVQIQGLEVERHKADGIFRDAEVMSAVEFAQHRKAYDELIKDAAIAEHSELITASAFRKKTFTDATGKEIERGELKGGPRTRVVLVRKPEALSPGTPVIISEFPVHPTTAPPTPATPLGGAIYNILVSTQPEAEGDPIMMSAGVIAYFTDFMTPMSLEKLETAVTRGTCSQTTQALTTVELLNHEKVNFVQYNPARRFERCDSTFVDSLGNPADGHKMIWGPMPGAVVSSGSRFGFPASQGAKTDDNGYYELQYPYEAGLVVGDGLYVGVAFAPHNPKVQFGSRYFLTRQVQGGPTFVPNDAAIAGLYQQAVDASFNPSNPIPENWEFIDSLGGPPNETNYLGWLAGLIIDTRSPRSYNFAFDVAYAIGDAELRNEKRSEADLDSAIVAGAGQIKIDDRGGKTQYAYSKPTYPTKSLVTLPFPSAPDADPDEEGGDGGVDAGGRTGYKRYLVPDAGDPASGAGDAGKNPLSELVDRGLVTSIARKDLLNTDVFIFGGNGELVSMRTGLREDEAAGVKCEGGNKQPFGGYTGPCADGSTGCIHCTLDPPAEEGPPSSARFTVKTFVSTRSVGNRYNVLLINRATGYVGTGYIDMTKVNEGESVIPDPNSPSGSWWPKSGLDDHPIYAKDGSRPIVMRPMNLTISAKRSPATSDAKERGTADYVIGFEGAGASTDNFIDIETQWRDWDGSALPALPDEYAPTGRIARVAESPSGLGRTSDSLIFNFPISAREQKTVRIGVSEIAGYHYYVHVSGQPAKDCGERELPCSGEGCDSTGARCPGFGRIRWSGNDPLLHRPELYAPFKVPVYDEVATLDALKTQARLARENSLPELGKVKPIYREVYRPEYQFTVFDVPEMSDADLTTRYDEASKKSVTNLVFDGSLEGSGGLGLTQLGPGQVPLWSLGYEELLATSSNPIKFENIEDLLRMSPARQLLEIENIAASLKGSAFLGLQLYVDNDRGNPIYENYSVPLLLTEAVPIDLNRHVNLTKFEDGIDNVPKVEDYRAIRFALTSQADIEITAKTCDKSIKLFPPDAIGTFRRGVGVYYLVLETESLSKKKLPQDFTLVMTATPRPEDPNDPNAGKGQFPHKVEFPVHFATHVEGQSLGQVFEHDVNLADGSLNLSRKDFAIDGLGPNLAMERSYSNVGGGGDLGPGWSHNYENSLIPVATNEYDTFARPEWLDKLPGATSGDIPMIADAKDVEPGLYHGVTAIELTMVTVNGSTFRKVEGKWKREYGRHGRLEQRDEESCEKTKDSDPAASDPSKKGCFVYFAADGTSYRYRIPNLKTFSPPELGTKPTMIGTTNGLAMRAGLDAGALLLGDQPATLPSWTPGRYHPMPLLSTTDKYGNRTTISYIGEQVDKVRDAWGRFCQFGYGSYQGCDPKLGAKKCERLRTVTCLSGDDEIKVEYDYDATGYLNMVTQARRVEEYGYTTANSSCGTADRNLTFTRRAPWLKDELAKTRYDYREGGEDATADLGQYRDPVPLTEMVKTVQYPPTHAAKGDGVLRAEFEYPDATTRTVSTVVSEQGITKTYILNPWGNPTRILEPGNKETKMKWSVDGAGGCSSKSYTDGLLLSKSVWRDAETKWVTTGYDYDEDGNGNIENECVCAGESCAPSDIYIVQKWSKSGQELESRQDLQHGTVESWEIASDINAFGDTYEYVASHTDRNDVTTTFERDPDYPGRHKSETVLKSDPPKKTLFSYDKHGNLSGQKTEGYEGIQYVPDLRGRVTSIINAAGKETTYAFDKNDNVKSLTLPEPTKSIQPPDDMAVSSQSTFTYDPEADYDDAGNQLLQMNRNGLVLHHEYTYLGQIKKTTRDFDKAFREFWYDEQGHLTQESDWQAEGTAVAASGALTKYEYDQLGFQKSVTNRLNHTMSTERDTLGNVILTTDYENLQTKIAYDIHGKEQSRTIVKCDNDDCGQGVSVSQPDTNPTSDMPISVKYKISLTDELGHVVVSGYDGLDRLVYRKGPEANQIRKWTYDAAGMLSETVDEEEVTTQFSYDARGFPLSKTIKPGHGDDGTLPATEVTIEYREVSATGNILTEVRKREGHEVVTDYVYDEWDRLISRSEPHGTDPATFGTERFLYDGENNLVYSQDVAGDARAWYRDPLGRVLSYVDAETAQGNGSKKYSGDCENGSQKPYTNCFVYNENGTVKRQVDARGVETSFDYDEEEREKSRTETGRGPDGEETRTWSVTERDKMGNVKSLTNYRGNTKTFTYTPRHLLWTVSEQGIPEHDTVYTYTPSGKIKTKTVGGLFVRTYNYDNSDRLSSVEFEDKGEPNDKVTEVTYTYDRLGNVATVKNQAGEITERRYDNLRRHQDTYQSSPSLSSTKVLHREFDEQGNVRWLTKWRQDDSDSVRIEQQYNDLNQLRYIIFPAPDAGTIERTYNSQGLLWTETTPEGYKTTYQYDHEGRMTSKIIGESGAAETFTYTYDLAGNLLTETQPESQAGGKYDGSSKIYEYNAFGYLKKVTDEARIVTTFNPDLAGNVEDVWGPEDPAAVGLPKKGHVHRDYDAADRLRSVEKTIDDTKTMVTKYDYLDAHDNPRTITRPNGAVQVTYDKYSRPRTETYPASTSSEWRTVGTTRVYDDKTNTITTTERKKQPDGTAVSDVATEQNNLATDFKSSSVQRGSTISYRYNRDGSKQQVESPNGKTSYTYDTRGRLKTVKIIGSDGGEREVGYGYDDNTRSMTVTFPNGATAKYEHYQNGRVKTITHKMAGHPDTVISYEYDRNGNPTKITDTADGVADTTNFDVYDATGRLWQFSQDGKTTEYKYHGYDRSEEIVHTGDVQGPVEKRRIYGYNEGRQLGSVTESGQGMSPVTYTHSYDLNGNLISRTGGASSDDMNLAYNARDELVRVAVGGQTVGLYDYDSEGRRIRQRGTDRGDVDSIYDESSVLEEQIVGGPNNRLHYGLSLLARIGSTDPEDVAYFHQDAQGTTRHLSDLHGNRSASYKHDPWGNVREKSGGSNNRITYTQQQYDPMSGLYYYGARYYDPKIGRFITEDSYPGDGRDPPSLNGYIYANSNPARFTDPTGHSPVDNSGSVGSGGGGTVFAGGSSGALAWTSSGAMASTGFAAGPLITIEDRGAGSIKGRVLRGMKNMAKSSVTGLVNTVKSTGRLLGALGESIADGDFSPGSPFANEVAFGEHPILQSESAMYGVVYGTLATIATGGAFAAAGAGMFATAMGAGVIGGAVGRGVETGVETGSLRQGILAAGNPEAILQDAAFSALAFGMDKVVGAGIRAARSAGRAMAKAEGALLGRVENAASGKASLVSPTESRSANAAIGSKAATKSPGVRGEAGPSRVARETLGEGPGIPGCNCFAAGTLVATVQGLRAIEDVEVGDLVLSRAADGDPTEYRPVTRVFVTPDRELTSLTFELVDGTTEVIESSPGHPFWVEGRGWTLANELQVGSTVQTAEGALARLSTTLSLDKRATVFNFEVEGTHTYFVGRGEHWVHNVSACEVKLGAKGAAKPTAQVEPPLQYDAHLKATEALPVFRLSRSDQAVAAHAEMVLRARAKGHSGVLTRGEGSRAADKNRYESQKRIRKAQGGPKRGYNYDEYPYASSRQGGAGAHIEEILADPNQEAGRRLGRFLEKYVKPGEHYRVIIDP